MKADITIGLPGCGKSTWAANQGATIIERDKIRAEIATENGSEFSWETWDVGVEQQVTERWNKALEDLIVQGVPVIVADTNLNARFRRELVSRLREVGYSVRYVVFDVPAEVCRERNAGRNPRLRAADEAYDRLVPLFEETLRLLEEEGAEFDVSVEILR